MSNIILHEYAREVRRNIRGITDFYRGAYFTMILSPLVYLVGVIEPIPETIGRHFLNHYPRD